jgi:hypothetical protein
MAIATTRSLPAVASCRGRRRCDGLFGSRRVVQLSRKLVMLHHKPGQRLTLPMGAGDGGLWERGRPGRRRAFCLSQAAATMAIATDRPAASCRLLPPPLLRLIWKQASRLVESQACYAAS